MGGRKLLSNILTWARIAMFAILRSFHKFFHRAKHEQPEDCSMKDSRNIYNSRDRPKERGRRFYAIEEQPDGPVDVYLSPVVCTYDTGFGIREYDISIRVVRGIIPWPELEQDIRQRYDSWCEIGEVIDL